MLIALLTVLTITRVFQERLRRRRGRYNRGVEGNPSTEQSATSTSTITTETRVLYDLNMSNYLGSKHTDQQSDEDNGNDNGSGTGSGSGSGNGSGTGTGIGTGGGTGTVSGSGIGSGSGMDTDSVINFKSGDRDRDTCHEIKTKCCTVVGSAGTHDHGSSKVKLKNIVDYKWENKHYPGRLIAVHIDGKHIAYTIKVSNKSSRMEGMVRVVNPQSGMRALIKGMTGEVLDLHFAHIMEERLLASIDMSSLFVHKIDVLEDSLLLNLILKVEDPLHNYTPRFDRVSWCPYLEGDTDDDDKSKLLVWIRGSTFQCFNVSTIIAEHGIGKITPKHINSGYLRFHDDSLTFTWATLSPDGSTLGVCSTDGIIRFFQVYMHDKDSRCLHQWKPHNGKPPSFLCFLDDLTKPTNEPYWKFAITGGNNNTEFKVWDCGNWECLQTVKLTVADDDDAGHFLAEIDRTASYLVVSNLQKRVLYILQIVNLASNSSKAGASDCRELSNNISNDGSAHSEHKQTFGTSSMGLVHIKSISEFPLNSGILSFSIVDAAVRRYKCGAENYMCDEYDDYDEENNSIYCVVLRMFIVQSKSMQECHVIYQPTVTENTDVKSSIYYESSSATNDNDDASTQHNGNKSSLDELAGSNEKLSNVKSELSTTECSTLESLLAITSEHSAGEASKASVPEEPSHSRSASPQSAATASAAKGFNQPVNLMTPDAFSSTAITEQKKTPETVSTEVLNTLLMLASVTGQNAAPPKTDSGMNLLNLMNNTVLEDQEHQKVQRKAMESQKKFIAIDNNPGRKMGDTLASGGSSPSREVQEIMSLQDFDKSSYSGDEMLDGDSTTDGIINKTITAPEHEPAGMAQVTKWPKAPDVPKQKHSAELQNAANLISQAVHASSVGNLNSSHLAPPLLASASASSNSNNNVSNNALPGMMHSSNLTDISVQLGQLIELVKMQSKQINCLQKEVSELRNASITINGAASVGGGKGANANVGAAASASASAGTSAGTAGAAGGAGGGTGGGNAVAAKNLNDFAFKIEMQLSKLMEQYLKRYENEHNKKLATFMAGREKQNRELSDTFLAIINQYLLKQINDVVAKIFSIEMQRQFAPIVLTKLDQVQAQIQIDVTQKLATFDTMFKENLANMCKSKSFIDAFSKSVLVGVQSSLQTAFIESMSSTLIPAYEKSSQNMFKQLHDAFSVGIREFMEQFDTYLQQLMPLQEQSEQIVGNFAGFRQHMEGVVAKQRTAVDEGIAEMRKDIKNMELTITRQMQEAMRLELRKHLETQMAVALRSQANTPAPGYDMKETIRHLLHSGQVNKAFHQALLANDLNLVEYTLKNVDPSAVFTPNCCLEQKVILSLIQQISADMSQHNELKQMYLNEALFAINPLDAITREHAPKVLQELFRNCNHFLNNYPKNSQCSNVRMMLRAIQSNKDFCLSLAFAPPTNY